MVLVTSAGVFNAALYFEAEPLLAGVIAGAVVANRGCVPCLTHLLHATLL